MVPVSVFHHLVNACRLTSYPGRLRALTSISKSAPSADLLSVSPAGLSELGPEVIKAFVLPQVKPLGARLERLTEQAAISPADKLAMTHLKQLFAVSGPGLRPGRSGRALQGGRRGKIGFVWPRPWLERRHPRVLVLRSSPFLPPTGICPHSGVCRERVHGPLSLIVVTR